MKAVLEDGGMVGDITDYRKKWIEGVSLDTAKDLAANAVDELEAYAKLPRSEVERLLYHGVEEFAREWNEKYRDLPDARSRFYDESMTQIFFVMQNNALRSDLSSPYLYVYAAEWAKELGTKTYADYGCGTGSGAFFFARQGIKTTCADISARMLDFVKWRFQRRGLKADFLNIKERPLPKNSFDMITCFHVLQHLEDPVAKVRELRGCLTENGILIVNGGLTKDPDRPMQPDHGGLKTTRKFRSTGLQILWEPTHVMRKLSNTNPQAYQRVERPPFMNAAYYLFDTKITAPWLRQMLRHALQPLAAAVTQKQSQEARPKVRT